MRYLILTSILIAAVWFTGCSNSTLVTTTDPITFSRTSGFAHLEAGGLTILSPGDTLVNFDLVPDVSVTNATDTPMHLYAVWSFDSVAPGALHPVDGTSDTLDLGIFSSNGSKAIDSSVPVAWPASIANAKLEYELEVDWYDTLNGKGSGSGIGHLAPFDSVPFASRWRGILHTVESSPTVIDTLDGPDDGDWAGSGILAMKSAVPNPTVRATTIQYSLLESADSVRLVLAETPHHILRSVSSGTLQPGAYVQQLGLTGIASGLYRMFLTAYKNGIASQSRGDIMVPLH